MGKGAFDIVERARALEAQGVDMIHLEVGEPDFATPEHIVAAGVWGMQNGRTTYTSASGTAEMRGAIANYVERTRGTAVSPANILIAPGVKAALYYTLIALVDPGDEVLMPDPGFPGYQEITRIAGGIPVMFPLRPENEFQPDVAEIESLITARTKCILLNSPGNPSGTINGRSHLEAIAQLAQQHDLWIVSDEIYAQLYYTAEFPPSIYSLPGMAERTILLDGLSKPYAMTGWRLGFGIFPEPMVAPVTKLMVNSHTCVPLFIQDAGMAALKGSQACVTMMREAYRQRRDMVLRELSTMPQLSFVRPVGAFYVMLGTTNGRNVSDLCDEFLQAGVALLPCKGMGDNGRHYMRFALTKPAERLQEALMRMKSL
jgi:aspartate/methionine/tyrosine aminotransferase